MENCWDNPGHCWDIDICICHGHGDVFDTASGWCAAWRTRLSNCGVAYWQSSQHQLQFWQLFRYPRAMYCRVVPSLSLHICLASATVATGILNGFGAAFWPNDRYPWEISVTHSPSPFFFFFFLSFCRQAHGNWFNAAVADTHIENIACRNSVDTARVETGILCTIWHRVPMPYCTPTSCYFGQLMLLRRSKRESRFHRATSVAKETPLFITGKPRDSFEQHGLAVWCSGNALVSINAVALHRARLVLGWVTAFGQVNCLIT